MINYLFLGTWAEPWHATGLPTLTHFAWDSRNCPTKIGPFEWEMLEIFAPFSPVSYMLSLSQKLPHFQSQAIAPLWGWQVCMSRQTSRKQPSVWYYGPKPYQNDYIVQWWSFNSKPYIHVSLCNAMVQSAPLPQCWYNNYSSQSSYFCKDIDHSVIRTRWVNGYVQF